LAKCLKALTDGDTLIVWELDRLGRSLRDLITLLDDLQGRRVAFRSLTEAIDTATPTGRAMWQMVGILAELERSLLLERTKAGRAAAVARGVKMGRKPLLSTQQVAHARKLLEQGERTVAVARLFNVSWRTMERAL
jgi:DNA invertase Pin-like site-specific DNA recombinase